MRPVAPGVHFFLHFRVRHLIVYLEKKQLICVFSIKNHPHNDEFSVLEALFQQKNYLPLEETTQN